MLPRSGRVGGPRGVGKSSNGGNRSFLASSGTLVAGGAVIIVVVLLLRLFMMTSMNEPEINKAAASHETERKAFNHQHLQFEEIKSSVTSSPPSNVKNKLSSSFKTSSQKVALKPRATAEETSLPETRSQTPATTTKSGPSRRTEAPLPDSVLEKIRNVLPEENLLPTRNEVTANEPLPTWKKKEIGEKVRDPTTIAPLSSPIQDSSKSPPTEATTKVFSNDKKFDSEEQQKLNKELLAAMTNFNGSSKVHCFDLYKGAGLRILGNYLVSPFFICVLKDVCMNDKLNFIMYDEEPPTPEPTPVPTPEPEPGWNVTFNAQNAMKPTREDWRRDPVQHYRNRKLLSRSDFSSAYESRADYSEDPRYKAKYDFPKLLFRSGHSTFLDVRPGSGAQMLAKSVRYKKWYEGNTVALAHAFCCSHPTHFMEPLGALSAGLEVLRGNGTTSRGRNRQAGEEGEEMVGCIKDDLDCLPPREDDGPHNSPSSLRSGVNSSFSSEIDTVVVLNSARIGQWAEGILRMVVDKPGAAPGEKGFANIIQMNKGRGGTISPIRRPGRVVFDHDSDPLQRALKEEKQSVYHCFERLIVPGMWYEVWPGNTSFGGEFVDRMKEWYAKAAKKASPEMGMRQARTKVADNQSADIDQSETKLAEEEPVATKPNQDGLSSSSTTMMSAVEEKKKKALLKNPPLTTTRPRKLLYAIRTAKRKVWDEKALLFFLKVFMNWMGGVVRAVKFTSYSFYNQSLISQEADILMGIHGADLTNMIWQPKGSVVFEINPIFFFEPRFKLMADRLGNHYMTWTCTTKQCAYAGKGENYMQTQESQLSGTYKFQWDAPDLGDKYYNLSSPRSSRTIITSKENNGVNFTWPCCEYIDPSCTPCNFMMCCSRNKGRFWSGRESNVLTAPHFDEIGLVLIRSAKKLGWIKEEEEGGGQGGAPSSVPLSTKREQELVSELMSRWKQHFAMKETIPYSSASTTTTPLPSSTTEGKSHP